MILLLLWGGVLADRFPRAVVLQVSNVASALSQGAIAYLVLSGRAELWMIIVLTAFHGAVSGDVDARDGRHGPPARAARVAPAGQRAAVADPQRPHGAGPLPRRLPRRDRRDRAGPWRSTPSPGRSPRCSCSRCRSRRAPRGRRRPRPCVDLREGWTFFRSVTWLWVVVAGLRRPQHDPQRRPLHPRTGGRGGHDRPPGVGVRALRRGRRPARDGRHPAALPARASTAAGACSRSRSTACR